MAIIEVSNLKKSFGNLEVLKQITFNVNKNDVVAEYTLDDIHNPIGISSYKLFDQLSKDYKSSLPSIEEIEKQLNTVDTSL